jgi:hypothetical protein
MGSVLEGSRIRGNDDVAEDGKFRVNRGWTIDGGDRWNCNIEHVHDQFPESLSALHA